MEPKQFETIGAGIVGAIALFLTLFKDSILKWSKNMLVRLFKTEKIEESFGAFHAEREKRINVITTELRYKTDADRSYIFKFHNGEYFSPRDPLWKITCTNEVVRTGIAYTYRESRAILVSNVIEWLMPLFGTADVTGSGRINKEDCACKVKCDLSRNIVWYDVRSMMECSAKAFLIERGAHFVILAPLIRDNHVFGFVGIDYCTEVNQTEMLHYAQDVCQSANLMSGLMETEKSINE